MQKFGWWRIMIMMAQWRVSPDLPSAAIGCRCMSGPSPKACFRAKRRHMAAPGALVPFALGSATVV